MILGMTLRIQAAATRHLRSEQADRQDDLYRLVLLLGNEEADCPQDGKAVLLIQMLEG